jgi:hypothetical protein
MRPFPLRLYWATTTKHPLLDRLLAETRAAAFAGYDFRASGRGPAKIFNPDREVWTPADYITALASPIPRQQYAADRAALDACDCVVLLTPCGNDAHSEAGYAHGRNIPVIVYLGAGFRPGLMHKFFNGFVADIPGLLSSLSRVVPRDAAATGDVSSEPGLLTTAAR